MKKSGVLMPIFSLPSKYGMGCFSNEATEFIDKLAKSGQSYWQILPLAPCGKGNSPYQPISSFAGEPFYISPEKLYEKGLITETMLNELAKLAEKIKLVNTGRIDYDELIPPRMNLLRSAFRVFQEKFSSKGTEDPFFKAFRKYNKSWLNDYALYMAIKTKNNGKDWIEWEDNLKFRNENTLKEIKQEFKNEILFWKWTQYEFFNQWMEISHYAHEKDIKIIGDIPIYSAYESSECWAHPELFMLNEKKEPIEVSGAPADAFTPDGQCWGNPLYDWEYQRETGYDWWFKKLHQNFKMYDMVRLDHMRGFQSYFAIPANTRNPKEGHWVDGPNMDFLSMVLEKFDEDKFIAEDLGFLTPEVFDMIEKTGFPGMKILQFAFDSGEENIYLPDNFTTDNSVVYTGTHDNNTTIGWYKDLPEYKQRFVSWYINKTIEGYDYNPDGEVLTSGKALVGLIELAFNSRCLTAIIPMQDWLSKDGSARTNLPGTPEGNWGWQMGQAEFNDSVEKKIFQLTQKYERLSDSAIKNSKKPRALVVGCLSIDVCPEFVVKNASNFADVIKPGSITRILGNKIYPGGSVANVGIAMNKFGIEPILCGKIGNDDFGAMITQMLAKELDKESLQGIITKADIDTAYSLILAPGGLDRAILQNPGANDEFLESEVDIDKYKDNCVLLHFGHPPTLKGFYSNGGFGLVSLFSRAKKAGLVTSLDLCQVDPYSESAKEDWEMILTNTLPLVDFFLPSIDELRYMLNMPNASAKDLAAKSISLGAKNILIKLGKDGIYVENSSDFKEISTKLGFEANHMKDWENVIGHVPAVKVNHEVSGLGAGDVSVAAYLSAMLRGFSVKEALKYTIIEGALCVTKSSATEGLKQF